MLSPINQALVRLCGGHDLTSDQCHLAVAEIMDGQASEVLIAAFLTSLRTKGETAAELAGAVQAIRSRMLPFERDFSRPVLDTCGTGGDGASTVNISTAAAIVVAACGVAVAKHGNRSSTGNSGSSEALDKLGVNHDPGIEVAQRCLKELGLTYLFAPRFHASFRHAASVRKQLPFRTLFNLVGPLANPALPEWQLLGVPDESHAELIAQVLSLLGVQRAAVVTGGDGLDEITLDGPTWVRWVEKDFIENETWEASDFGLPKIQARDLRVANAQESANRIRQIFEGQHDPAREVIAANAAAALRIAGQAESLAEGTQIALNAISNGSAHNLLARWITLSHQAI